jgi:chromosome segregation ATPase
MAMSNLDSRLEVATKRRSELAAEVQRITGRLESARQSLADIEAECREKGIEPEKLEETITKLTQRYEAEVTQLEEQVAEAEAALEPFLKES